MLIMGGADSGGGYQGPSIVEIMAAKAGATAAAVNA